jgi:hypothetical protein
MNWKSDLIRSRVGRFVLESGAKFYDQVVCSAGTVRSQTRESRKKDRITIFHRNFTQQSSVVDL